MLQMDEDQIKETLKHYQAITQQIHARVLSIRQMMDETNDQLIEIASYPKIDFGKTSARSGTRKDLLDVYERYQKLIEEKEQNFAEELRELLARAESVKRLYLCYQALGNEAYEIVDKLYIQRIPYKAVEAESGLNHRILRRRENWQSRKYRGSMKVTSRICRLSDIRISEATRKNELWWKTMGRCR